MPMMGSGGIADVVKSPYLVKRSSTGAECLQSTSGRSLRALSCLNKAIAGTSEKYSGREEPHIHWHGLHLLLLDVGPVGKSGGECTSRYGGCEGDIPPASGAWKFILSENRACSYRLEDINRVLNNLGASSVSCQNSKSFFSSATIVRRVSATIT